MDLGSVGTYLFARVTEDPMLSVVVVILIIALVQIFILSRRVARLTRGATGASLESAIVATGTDVARLMEHAKVTETALNNLDTRIGTALRAAAVRRFDPFQNAGGQQSFAAALVNEKGDGVVISGIHARDSVRVYAKDIENFSSERELSDDERAAIADAKRELA